jgi:hypothetical protein
MRAAWVGVLMLLLLGACAGSSEVAGDRRVVGDVTMAFTVTPARVEVGRSVRFALRLTNNGGRSRDLDFASGQLYDFWVTDGDREVWRWSDEMTFTQALEKRTIPTQDSVVFEESWTSEGRPGTYVAHGLLKAEGYERELTGEVIVRG